MKNTCSAIKILVTFNYGFIIKPRSEWVVTYVTYTNIYYHCTILHKCIMVTCLHKITFRPTKYFNIIHQGLHIQVKFENLCNEQSINHQSILSTFDYDLSMISKIS